MLAVDTSFSDVSITNSIELRLIGHLVSLTKIVPLGATMLRPVQRDIAYQWNPEYLPQYFKRGYEGHSELVFSRDQLQSRGVSTSFHKDSRHLHDASNLGWGACMNVRSVHSAWPPGEKRHINVLEMTAVLHSCQSFLEQIRDKDVMIFPDNSTVVAYVNHQGGTKSINTSRVA